MAAVATAFQGPGQKHGKDGAYIVRFDGQWVALTPLAGRRKLTSASCIRIVDEMKKAVSSGQSA